MTDASSTDGEGIRVLTREAEDALLLQALREGMPMREFLKSNIDTLFRSFVRENMAECLLQIKYPLTEHANVHQRDLQAFVARNDRLLAFILDKVFLSDMSEDYELDAGDAGVGPPGLGNAGSFGSGTGSFGLGAFK